MNDEIYPVNKIAAYANALDGDITAEPWKQVRNGALWRGFVGAIYGCAVGTDKGTTFDTWSAAMANAMRFREQCREILQKQSSA